MRLDVSLSVILQTTHEGDERHAVLRATGS